MCDLNLTTQEKIIFNFQDTLFSKKFYEMVDDQGNLISKGFCNMLIETIVSNNVLQDYFLGIMQKESSFNDLNEFLLDYFRLIGISQKESNKKDENQLLEEIKHIKEKIIDTFETESFSLSYRLNLIEKGWESYKNKIKTDPFPKLESLKEIYKSLYTALKDYGEKYSKNHIVEFFVYLLFNAKNKLVLNYRQLIKGYIIKNQCHYCNIWEQEFPKYLKKVTKPIIKEEIKETKLDLFRQAGFEFSVEEINEVNENTKQI